MPAPIFVDVEVNPSVLLTAVKLEEIPDIINALLVVTETTVLDTNPVIETFTASLASTMLSAGTGTNTGDELNVPVVKVTPFSERTVVPFARETDGVDNAMISEPRTTRKLRFDFL